MTWLSDRAVKRLRTVANWPDFSHTKYELVEQLGRGGMGTVYRARDTELGREVAIKVGNAAAPRPEWEARMRTEAQILGQLEHPGIVPVHDVGVLADGQVYYVMKVVRGRSLAAILSSEPPSQHQGLQIFERMCDAVAFAHARGFVHRDLKPENIMVGPFGEVLVMDWGVAKILSAPEQWDIADRRQPAAPSAPDLGTAPLPAARPGTTDPGTIMGTPGYMSPEQALGEVERIDQRSDVYALGAILCLMLTGRPPADDVRSSRPATVKKRLHAIYAKALALEPRDRYADAAELGSDVAKYRQGLPVVAYPEGPLDVALRLATKYRTAILLVLAYLIMRIVVGFAMS